ncbi:MAG: hypothetical protein PHR77_20545 [Kiritimatiellae bacterium]|nr:hypothetical protein [Kiritimatiellia bacterium]MDD5520074.1 hypothetical protein [Kiritimatiellia bacterium]
MGDKIFNIIWGLLMVWTCWKPNGYAPYVLLGINSGDLLITMLYGFGYGYLEEEGDFQPGSFLTSIIGFLLLGGFYAGNLSFQPGTDAYSYALYLIFASFFLSFGYRFAQYGLVHLPGRD